MNELFYFWCCGGWCCFCARCSSCCCFFFLWLRGTGLADRYDSLGVSWQWRNSWSCDSQNTVRGQWWLNVVGICTFWQLVFAGELSRDETAGRRRKQLINRTQRNWKAFAYPCSSAFSSCLPSTTMYLSVVFTVISLGVNCWTSRITCNSIEIIRLDFFDQTIHSDDYSSSIISLKESALKLSPIFIW